MLTGHLILIRMNDVNKKAGNSEYEERAHNYDWVVVTNVIW